MPQHFRSTAGLILAAGLSLAALTGCAAGGGEQSVEEACSIAESSVEGLQSDLGTIQSDATSGNYSAVAEQFETLHDGLRDAEGDVTNEEVKSALSDAADSVDTIASVFGGVEDGDVEGLSARADEFQAAGEDLQASGQRLSELCD